MITIRKRLASFLMECVRLILLDNKLPRLLSYFAHKLDGEARSYESQLTIVKRGRYDR